MEISFCGGWSAGILPAPREPEARRMPVREVDGHLLGNGAGAVTANLQQLYAGTVPGRGRRSWGWIEYVMMEPLF